LRIAPNVAIVNHTIILGGLTGEKKNVNRA
jgi:hypothetical protein